MSRPPSKNENRPSQAAIRARVDDLADKLGMPVDPGIKELVVALQANGLTTSGSCEGHIREDDRVSIPWVAIETPGPEGWQDSDKLQQQWREENLHLRTALETALDDFYQNRPTDFRLGTKPRGIYGATRLEPAIERKAMTAVSLPKYQHELNDFADFLLKRLN